MPETSDASLEERGTNAGTTMGHLMREHGVGHPRLDAFVDNLEPEIRDILEEALRLLRRAFAGEIRFEQHASGKITGLESTLLDQAKVDFSQN